MERVQNEFKGTIDEEESEEVPSISEEEEVKLAMEAITFINDEQLAI